MAKGNRKRVVILFLGGSTIDVRGRVGDTVLKEKDIGPWMEQMSEMNLIADTDGYFVAPGTSVVGIVHWQKAAEIIRREYDRADGFVVVHQIETIRAAAAAFTLILGTIGKPVVVVGSSLLTVKERTAGLIGNPIPYGGESGAKASIINAVQVAISDIAEVAVLYGSHIYRGYTIHRKVIDNHWRIDGEVLGKIDFGIRLFGQQVSRSSHKLRIRPDFDTKVAVFEYLPASDLGQLKNMTRGAHGIFLYAQEVSAFIRPTISTLVQSVPATIPVVVYTPTWDTLEVAPNVIPTWGPTRTAGLLCFMWALGQGKTVADVRRYIKQYEPKRK